MSSQELVEGTTSTKPNGESSEKNSTNGAGPEPQKQSGEGPLDQEKEGDDDYESAPEDLNDFIVLDEAEITESEGEDLPQEQEDDDEESMQWDCPLERLAPRTYTEKELKPTELDRRCKPDWPLAGYWPVYVGNFRLYRRFDSDYNCAHAVQTYFASKGLPTFMVYRLKDSFFEVYQKRVGFYDMLVYFCNKKDANRAIQWCHRDLYYGHKLNVYCGRTPSLFPSRKFRSYRIKHKKAEDKLETETNLENYLLRFGEIICISKQDLDNVLVQFTQSPWDTAKFSKDSRVQPFAVMNAVPKQRFVEANIEKELTKEIAKNPKFMQMRLKYKLLHSIKHGVIPEMRQLWEKPEVDEVVVEQRRQENWRQKSSYTHNVRETFKRRRENDNDSRMKSRRQLLREAKSLEHQLRRIKTKISMPVLPQFPVKQKTPSAIMQNTSPEPNRKSKRPKTEAQLLRQQIRGARRRKKYIGESMMHSSHVERNEILNSLMTDNSII